MAGTETRVPALLHLMALKLHAAKDAAPHRRYKDLIDIFYLVDANKVDVLGEQFREMCERYGTPDLYEEILRAARKHQRSSAEIRSAEQPGIGPATARVDARPILCLELGTVV